MNSVRTECSSLPFCMDFEWTGKAVLIHISLYIFTHNVCICSWTVSVFLSCSLFLLFLPSAVVRNLMQRCCISIGTCLSKVQLGKCEQLQTEHCSQSKRLTESIFFFLNQISRASMCTISRTEVL